MLGDHITVDLADQLVRMRKELIRASVDVKHPCHAVVLSTVSAQHRPQSCWVILRKVEIDKMELVFFTDFRSRKVQNLEYNRQAAVTMYHPRQRYQWRMQGIVSVHHHDDLTKDYFKKYVKNAKDYTGLYAPGREIEHTEEGWQQIDGPSDQYFAVLRFTLEEWDWLQLSRDGHKRAVYTFENGLVNNMNWVSP